MLEPFSNDQCTPGELGDVLRGSASVDSKTGGDIGKGGRVTLPGRVRPNKRQHIALPLGRFRLAFRCL